MSTFHLTEPGQFLHTHFETSLFLSSNLAPLLPLQHLPSAFVLRPAFWLAFFSPQGKRQSPLREAHNTMWILQTARSLHSLLHLPPGNRWQGSSPSQGRPRVLPIFFQHGGPESTLGFQTDPSFLQGATTVLSTIFFFGQTDTLFHIIDISPEEDSGEEVHLRKTDRREKPQTCWSKRNQYLRKDYKKISGFFSKLKLLNLKVIFNTTDYKWVSSSAVKILLYRLFKFAK